MKQLCSCSSHKYVREIYGRKKMCEVDDVTLDMFFEKVQKKLKGEKEAKRRECSLSKDMMELYYQGISLYF